MAKKESKPKQSVQPVRDKTLWYNELAFSPVEDKNQLWMAQMLFFAKQNGKRFLDPQRCGDYRKLDRLEVDEKLYKQLVDPPTPMGVGGTAEYFAADWKANPIYIHIDNIIEARLNKICLDNKIQVNEIDKYAKSQRQRDKEKIIWQREFRNLINELNQATGKPKIKESEDPYSYAQSLQKGADKDGSHGIDGLLDLIKNKIHDSQDIALYESYIYKGNIEIAFELGIKHYLINLNKWHIISQSFNRDLKHFNKACGTWEIDQTTGRGTVAYQEPTELHTNTFKEKNGEDILFWFIEEDITFADFVRRFGMTLTNEQLKEVFELNKVQGGGHGMNWGGAKGAKGSNAKIRIGQFSCLTQDAERFLETNNGSTSVYQQKPLTWLPTGDDTIKQKIYNVWYSCYYVPPPSSRLSSNAGIDWAWQSHYIFDLHKDIDMYRYGVDARYAKSRLVIWKDERASFTDIQQAYMPKINMMWHKFQNCIVQDTTATVFASDFMMGLLNVADEANKNNEGSPDKSTGGNGVDAVMTAFRSIKQGGIGMFNFMNKQGMDVVDPSKLFFSYDSHHLDKAERWLKLMMEQYQMMQVALAQSDISEGNNPKPRTNEMSIEASLQSTSDGIWFIEKPVREFLVMYGERCVQYILNIVKENKIYGFKERWEEFKNVIGLANSLLLESIEDLEPEEIGITVSLEDVHAMQDYVFQLANKMADDGEVGREVVGLIMNQAAENYKYAYVLLMVAAKEKQREKAAEADLQHQQQMELQQMQLKIAQTLQQGKTQSQIAIDNNKGQIEAKLEELISVIKTNSQKEIKDSIADNRIKADNNKIDKKENEENQKPFAKTTNSA